MSNPQAPKPLAATTAAPGTLVAIYCAESARDPHTGEWHDIYDVRQQGRPGVPPLTFQEGEHGMFIRRGGAKAMVPWSNIKTVAYAPEAK